MSLWQLFAALDGYIAAHTPEDQKSHSLSDDEFAALSDFVDRN